MDKFLTDKPAEVRSWSGRIRRAAHAEQGRAVAMLVKTAAPIAALSGHIDVVARWLKHVPEDVIASDPQLLYWSGASIVMQRPADAYSNLSRAFEMLCEQQPDGDWVLLAWAGVVDSVFLMYRDLRDLDSLLDWMTPERASRVDCMPRPPRCLVVASALFALSFRRPDHPHMAEWRDRAERLVETDPVSDLGARLTAGLILYYIWRGNLAAAAIAEKRFELRASRTKLSRLSSVMRHVNQATLALHQGRLDDCIHAVTIGLSLSSRLGVRMWDGIMHCHAIAASLSRGSLEQSDAHFTAIEELLADAVPIDEAFYRAMLLWRGFVCSDAIGAISRVAGAMELTDAKGVPYLMAVCRLACGLVLFEAGHHERGRALLGEGLGMGRESGNGVIEWMGGLFEAHMDYAQGRMSKGDAALRAALAIGRDHSLLHFICWPRRIVAKLVDRALERSYSSDYLQHLIAVHAFAPGDTPTRSDEWAFTARIYTFGQPRMLNADGTTEPLSAQFQRQIELLCVLIARPHRPVPLHTIATEMYGSEVADAAGSVKRVLHSLRSRFGPIVMQRNASLSLDFNKVWIDACSLQWLRRESRDVTEIEAWLDRHYAGQFMDSVAGSAVIRGLREQFAESAERTIGEVRARLQGVGDGPGLLRLQGRWQTVFPNVFESA